MTVNDGSLRWKMRRGMKELDVVMERYRAHRYDTAPVAEQQAFIELLNLEDPQIWAWVMGYEQPPAGEMGHVLEQLRRHR